MVPLSPKQQKWLLPPWGVFFSLLMLRYMRDAVDRDQLGGAIGFGVVSLGAAGTALMGLVVGTVIRRRTAIGALVVVMGLLAIPIVRLVMADAKEHANWREVSGVMRALEHVCETGAGADLQP